MLLKVELHAHTADDPVDIIPYSARDLIDRAAALGYHAIAITLHEKQLDVDPLRGYASARGVVLIPGIERTIEGKHVLLINFTTGAEDVKTFDDLAELKQRHHGLVIAPHPFYPGSCCLGRLMDRYDALIDAVELNGMHARGANFNEAAVRWAAGRGKPLVGNCDVHRLSQLGTTFSLVEADPDARSICDAIRAGRVEVRTSPLSWFRTLTVLGALFASSLRPMRGLRRRPSRKGFTAAASPEHETE